jgi:hypothetical protein
VSVAALGEVQLRKRAAIFRVGTQTQSGERRAKWKRRGIVRRKEHTLI